MLPNEAVRLTIGTKTQQLDVVTARVAVEECIVAVNEFLAQHPVSPTKYEVACCGSYAEYEVQEGPTRNDMLDTLPEYVRPPGAYISKMKVIKCAPKEGRSFKPSSERHNMPLLGIVLTGTI